MVTAAVTQPLAFERADAFTGRLYEEHVDEAALLYLQRATLLADPLAIGWKRLASLEARLEAHLDALIVGGGQALKAWSARHAAEGGIGELYVGARLLSQRGDWVTLRNIGSAADAPTGESIRALADALTPELPHDTDVAFRILGLTEEVWACVVLEVIARRRSDRRDIAMDALQSSNPVLLAVAARTVGELRNRRATAMLHRALDHDDPTVRSEAALALAKLGDAHVLSRCVDAAGEEDWPRLCLGMAGGPRAAAVLVRAIESGRATERALMSLGLLGDIKSIEPLLAYLGDHPLATTAALALDLITGAELTEDVVVDGAMHEDELFPHERERLTQDAAGPASAPPVGDTITRLSINPDQWGDWWRAHGGRFGSSARYRAGKPVRPGELIDCLRSDTIPRVVRELTHNELATRYGCSVGFSASLSVRQQERAIDACATWMASRPFGFHPGRWYYSGQLASY